MGSNNIKLGQSKVVLTGGFESMSKAPHYIYARQGTQFGHGKFVDGLMHDGLTDSFSGDLMGLCTEKTLKKYGITREMQDEVCINSYKNAIQAQKDGLFDHEIAELVDKKNNRIYLDEELGKFNPEKMKQLKPAFSQDGTITAANASKLSDGGAALIIMSMEEAQARNLKPLARIVSYADGAV